MLRFADYAGLGDAVSRTANEAMAELDPAARAQLPNLIAGLVRDFATDPTSGKPIPSIGALDRARFEAGRAERKALVEAFVEHRLLTAEGDAKEGVAGQRVRPTHESLLRIWPEAVAILTETAQLIRARAAIEPIAREWADAAVDKSRHLEVSPALLEGAIAYVARFGDDVSPATRNFVAEASAVAEQRRGRERKEQEQRIADAEAIAAANKKIARRTSVGLAAALALAAVAGWQWRESALAQHEAQIQRDRAERTLTAATETADALVFDLAQKFRDLVGMPKPLIKQILDRARKLQEQLLSSGETSAKLTRNHAAALGEIAVTELSLGDSEAALALALQSRDIFAKLMSGSPDVVNIYSYANGENIAGYIYRNQAKLDDAGAAFQRERTTLSLALDRGLSDPRLRQLLINLLEDLGGLAVDRGDLSQALQYYHEGLTAAQALATSHPDDDGDAQHRLAIAYRTLGDVEFWSDALDAADANFKAASEVALKLTQEHPLNSILKRDYSLSQERLGDALTKKGDFAGALTAYRDGEANAIEMARFDPANLEWQYDIAIGHCEVGHAEFAIGDLKSSETSFSEAVAIDETLVRKDPNNVLWRNHFSYALEQLGNVSEKLGDTDVALTAFREAAAFDEQIAAADANDLKYFRREIGAAARAGTLLLNAGKVDESHCGIAGRGGEGTPPKRRSRRSRDSSRRPVSPRGSAHPQGQFRKRVGPRRRGRQYRARADRHTAEKCRRRTEKRGDSR